ncbi:MAG TPA: hypothetical protein PKO15_09430 [Fibrobacteria bacterium]|nr:hypothetical protein [Fibrobacteria bacterium]HOX50747.1 hypothetical protein [Fibrobacteria bacterium]
MNNSFGIRNYLVIALGALVGFFGLYLLSLAPVDNPISLNVAPFVVLLGYLVLMPLGFLMPSGSSAASAKESPVAPGQNA